MRYLIAALVLLVAVPAGDASTKGVCKNRCQVQYEFCLKRATTDRGRKLCKIDRKTCSRTCR